MNEQLKRKLKICVIFRSVKAPQDKCCLVVLCSTRQHKTTTLFSVEVVTAGKESISIFLLLKMNPKEIKKMQKGIKMNINTIDFLKGHLSAI